MKYVVFSVLLFAATQALAEPNGICVDASSQNQYNARPLSQHEVLAKNAFGQEKRAAKLMTTCIHIDRASSVALHSFGRCIDKGDDVGISTMGGQAERCKVTGVTPADESYADAKYRYK